MQVVSAEVIFKKSVLLRYDIDVALDEDSSGNFFVKEDFKLKAGLDTLKLCLENASKVILIGHLGRPASPAQPVFDEASKTQRGEPFATAADEKNGLPKALSAKPILEWFKQNLTSDITFASTLEEAKNSPDKFVLLENIRFFHGEVPGADYHASCSSQTCDIDFAKQLSQLGEVYVNEAFSSHNPAASTTIVPTLMPHYAGLHFVKEVEVLLKVRNNPPSPFIALMGGAKVKDKLPVIQVLSQKADAVLVGGKLVAEIGSSHLDLPENVMVAKLSEDGFDIDSTTTAAWQSYISKAALIVWNGPFGKFEEAQYNQTAKVAEMILESDAEIVIGGGDSITALSQYHLLEKAEKKAFVSVGGGAMLKLISDGTLPTIEALQVG